ncbi:MAG: hypothetical protein WCK01_02220 [Candidatus Uhrbacteria bacterium]
MSESAGLNPFRAQIKSFSKQTNPEGRAQKAAEIRQARKERDSGAEPRDRELLDAFYAAELKRWKELPYDTYELAHLFSEENLESLSVDDYQFLLHRFPAHMVTHVKRQGVRDHYGHGSHTRGMGSFHNSVKKLFEKKRLSSVVGRWLEDGMQQEKIWKTFFTDCDTFEQAVERMQDIITDKGQFEGGLLTYADMSAVHLASEEVPDAYYGGEMGNEVFVAFPALHIASQQFSNKPLIQNRSELGNQHNDIWVWSQEHKGLSLDAALVFLPESTPVDPETGSRYEIDAQGNAIVDPERINRLKTIFSSSAFRDCIQHYGDQPYSQWLQETAKTCGLTNEELVLLRFFHQAKALSQDADGSELESVLRPYAGLTYRLAQHTVPAKQYWETYFTNHPKAKPSKIVWYNGNPTVALHAWQESTGSDMQHRPHTLFPEQTGEAANNVALSGLNEFVDAAEEVIKQHFPEEYDAALNAS